MIPNTLNALLIFLVALGACFSLYFKHPQESIQPLKIGILGESQTDSQDSPFNEDVLIKLLNVLKKRQVEVIFFTGDMVFGWPLKSNDSAKKLKTRASSFGILMDPGKGAEEHIYESQVFNTQLRSFSKVYEGIFDQKVPFYPFVGEHEAIGPGSAQIFRQVFNLKNSDPLGEDTIAYTVSLGNAFFVVFPTNYYDSKNQQTEGNSITPESLEWLRKVLKDAALGHKFIFVLGHEPAFTTPLLLNNPSSLERTLQTRDIFWEILKDQSVLAYFASHEHLYDRSNRFGVWQVISGGGGSPLKQIGGKNIAFFHCLLLTLPQNGEGAPKVEILDEEGNVRDEFELKAQEQQPLFQMRISSKKKTSRMITCHAEGLFPALDLFKKVPRERKAAQS